MWGWHIVLSWIRLVDSFHRVNKLFTTNVILWKEIASISKNKTTKTLSFSNNMVTFAERWSEKTIVLNFFNFLNGVEQIRNLNLNYLAKAYFGDLWTGGNDYPTKDINMPFWLIKVPFWPIQMLFYWCRRYFLLMQMPFWHRRGTWHKGCGKMSRND